MENKQIDFVKKTNREKKSKEKKDLDREISAPDQKFFEIISSVQEKPKESKGKINEAKSPGISERNISDVSIREDLNFEKPENRRNLEEVLGIGASSSSGSDSDLTDSASEEKNNNFKLYKETESEKKELSSSYGSQRSGRSEQRVSYMPQNVKQSRSNGFFRGFTTEEMTENHKSPEDRFIKDQREKYKWGR